MTLDEVRELIERQAHAWMVGNIELALPDFAPDAIFQSPGGRWEGREQIRETANKFFQGATDLKVTITRLIFDGHAGVVEWIWEETVRATNQRHMAEDAIVFEIVNRQIVYWREYFDTAQMSTPLA
jgi:uncharacterized protein (TIGR02246 family)